MSWFQVLSVLALILLAAACAPETEGPTVAPAAVQGAIDRLIETHGPSQTERVRRGVNQVAERWWPKDGDAHDFQSFCEEHFIADEQQLEQVLRRMDHLMEQVDGHMHEVTREIRLPADLDSGPVLGVDRLFGAVDLASHVDEDLSLIHI